MLRFMMMALAATLWIATPAMANHGEEHASHDHSSHDHGAMEDEGDHDAKLEELGKDCSNVTKIAVNGMVCDFCARAVEKVLGKRDDVSSVGVDLDAGTVLIAMKDGKRIPDSELEALIRDSGYDPKGITHGCS